MSKFTEAMDVASLEDGRRSEQSQLGEEHPRTSHKHMDVVAIDLQVKQRGATFVKEIEVVGRHCRSHFFFNLFGNSNLKLRIRLPTMSVCTDAR